MPVHKLFSGVHKRLCRKINYSDIFTAKQVFLNEKIKLRTIGAALCLITLVTVIAINSCKREAKSDAALPSQVAQAKLWYESVYPQTLSNTKGLVTQNIGAHTDLSQIAKPDWKHAAAYTRLGQNVIEMPFDPSDRLSFIFKTNTFAFNKDYSRSYYLILGDKQKYQAYILTFLADSDYVNNDVSKLANNSYRKVDASYSGWVVYWTPKGDYLGGYGYKNGKLTAPNATVQSGSQKIQSVDNGVLTPDKLVEKCYDNYYRVIYVDGNGNETYGPWQYVNTTCDWTDDGTGSTTNPGGGSSGGSTPGSGGSSGGSPSQPPPPNCPTGTGSSTTACSPPIEADALRTNYVPPPTDPGAPPPPSNCTVTVTTCPPVDPCVEKTAVSTRAAALATQNATILSKTTANGSEYGANQNLATLTGSTYKTTPVTTNGGTNSWTIGFTWDSTNGYTVGFSHGHPGNTGPSPDDIYALFSQINLQAALRTNATNKQVYESRASVTTMTNTGSYVVTVSDWAALSAILSNSFSDATQQAAFDAQYQTLGGQYINSNQNATFGDAGASALIQLFPGAINVYYAPPGSTTYTPITIAANSKKTVNNIPCPQQ